MSDPYGLDPIGGDKGGGKQRTPVEAPDSLFSTAIARIVDMLSEGEIVGLENGLKDVFFDETPVMNADGSLNFQSVSFEQRFGTPSQDPLPGFPSVQSEIGVGVELKQSTPWTRAISNLQLSAVKIRVAVQSLSRTDPSTGDTKGYRVDYSIDLAVDGGAFQTVFTSAFSGKTTSVYERTHRVDLPPATSGWTVRVRRLTPDNASQYIQDTTVIQAVTEIVDAKLRYPYCALVGLSLDSSQFRSIPSRSYRAKGRIIRVPVNYDPVARTYSGVWDGTFKMAWTTNPAWIYFDLVTNTRYGLGRRVPEARVDKWSLYHIGMYCDEPVPDGAGGMEPRFECTVYLQKQGDAYKVLKDLASVFRGVAYWGGGSIIAQADQPSDPVYTYTNANVKDGKFSYNGTGRKARHTVAMVAWSNPENFGRGEVEPVIDEQGIIRYGIQPTNVTAFGCTSQSQAQRVGRWILKTELAETDAISFEVGLDGTLVAPGRIVRVVDENRAGRRIGGRVSEVYPDLLVVDAMPTPPPMPGDKLITITAAGRAQTHVIHLVDGPGRTIILAAPFAEPPLKHSVWAVESSTLQGQLYRIIGITEGSGEGGMTFGLSAVQHEPSKFDAVDFGTQLETRPTSVLPSMVVQAPSAVTLTSFERAGQVVAQTVVEADWPNVPGASHYFIQWKRDDGDWSPPEKCLGSNALLQNTFPGKHWARVWAVGANAVASPYTLSNQLDVADQSLTPGFVDGLNASIADALSTAQNAQATADGAIQSFWQASPPTIGTGAGQASEGDLWFDTDDGNKVWRVVSGAWTRADDDDMAQAIAAATTAQATADGKVKTFFQAAAPTATGLGDLWFNTSTKKLFRWNGATWNDEIADVTLDQIGGNGINLLPDQYSTLEQPTLPSMQVDSATGTASRDATDKVVAAALVLAATAADHYAYLGTTHNIPAAPGRKYIVSGWFKGSVAGACDVYLQDSAGNHYGAQVSVTPAYARLSAIVDASASAATALRLRIDNDLGAGQSLRVDGLMVEELVGRLNKPSTYSRGQASGISLAALVAAQSAQATADGQIDIFRQASPPVVGGSGAKLGDYWQDSDDGKWYYCNGSSWVDATDSRLPQVVADAAAAQSAANTAQSTANARIRLFVQETSPAGGSYIVGDMWFQPSTTVTRYYNGTGWSAQADNSTTTQAYSTLIKDGGFEAGGIGWTLTGGAYFEASTNAAYSGTRGVVLPGNASLKEVHSELFPVSPGDRLVADAIMRNLGNGANGTLFLAIWYYAPDGSWLGAGNAAVPLSTGTALGSTEWRRVVAASIVPTGAGLARVGAYSQSQTSGSYCCDGFRVVKTQRTESRAANLVPNANFGGANGDYAPWFMGWNPAGAVGLTIRNKRLGLVSGADWTIVGNVGVLEVYQPGVGGGSPGVIDFYCGQVSGSPATKIPVKANTRYQFHTRMANHRCTSQLIVFWYDSADNYISEVGTRYYGGSGGKAEDGYEFAGAFATSPANAARCLIAYRRTDTAPGQADSFSWYLKPFFGEASEHQIEFTPWADSAPFNADSIGAGSTFSVVANENLHDVNGARRIGLSVRGSRHILGGPRNSRASIIAGVPSVRTATALTATSAGVVSVNAHSLELNGETVAYSAVTNAISGLTVGTTYVVFTIDPYLDGGARTYYAQTTVLSAQQAGDGCVFVGNVTIPSSGSSSGGSGGTGNPGDFCVDWDTVLPDGRLVRELKEGDLVECVDVASGERGLFPLRSLRFGEAERVRLVTADGASVVQSVSTPMDMPDGSFRRSTEMLGAWVMCHAGSSHVVAVEPVGWGAVCKPDLGGRMFFAGETAARTVATHNVNYKP